MRRAMIGEMAGGPAWRYGGGFEDLGLGVLLFPMYFIFFCLLIVSSTSFRSFGFWRVRYLCVGDGIWEAIGAG